MNHVKALIFLVVCIIVAAPLSSQVLQWEGVWVGGYGSGIPSDPWLVVQPTTAYAFQIFDTNYSTVTSFSLPIPGGALYYSVVAASPDFDTDGNIEVLYQYMDATYYKQHVFLRDIATSSNQLAFSDTDTSYYSYSFYFGSERVIIITGTYDSSNHAWLYRSNNPQSVDESKGSKGVFNPFLSIYPNPTVKCTEINYSIPNDGKVEVTIYDLAGKRVNTLISTHLPEGNYTTPWYGTDSTNRILPSGTYFCVVNIEGKTVSKKMVLLK